MSRLSERPHEKPAPALLCGGCKKELAELAVKCPHCRRKTEHRGHRYNIATILYMTLALFVLLPICAPSVVYYSLFVTIAWGCILWFRR
jgi:hypothetical protein